MTRGASAIDTVTLAFGTRTALWASLRSCQHKQTVDWSEDEPRRI